MRFKEIINETSTAGGSSAGGIATAVSGLGAGDPAASIYYGKKNKKMPVIKRQVSEKPKKD